MSQVGKATEQTIGKKIVETLALEKQLAEILTKIDANKASIQRYFDEHKIKTLEVEASGTSIKAIAKKQERVTLKYNAEALKKKLDPEVFLEVSKRTYTIPDVEAMIKLVRNNGVSAKEFKALIDTDIKIDNQAIKRLYDAHEINMNDLKGCYEAVISKKIIVDESKGDTN